jgi:hypothetical protein
MRLYQFNLPDVTNDLQRDYDLERELWRERAVEKAGGASYTGQATGYWNDANGRTVKEPMHVYQVACDPETASYLVAYAQSLFLDQDALFVADLGEARIIERPKIAQLA